MRSWIGNKLKTYSIQINECTTVESSCVGENSVLSDFLSEGNQLSGLIESMSNFTVDDSETRFQVPVYTVLLYFDKKDKLFKITVKKPQ